MLRFVMAFSTFSDSGTRDAKHGLRSRRRVALGRETASTYVRDDAGKNPQAPPGNGRQSGRYERHRGLA
jgi:hypothetical protein